MGAREKLNTIHIVGTLGAAGLLGLVTGSWILAVLAGALLVARQSIPAMSGSRGVVEPRPVRMVPPGTVLACRGRARCRGPGKSIDATKDSRVSFLTGMNVSEGRVAARSYADHPSYLFPVLELQCRKRPR